jgi:glycosyltransferase involved in cell wall biosynthesis
MKKIAIILNGSIKNDYRVIKTIKTLSKQYEIHLFYVNGTKSDELIFEDNVKLNPFVYKVNFLSKLVRNSFFCFEYNFFIKLVLNTNVKFDAVWSNDLPTLFPASKIALKLNCKLIYDSHEIYIETINQFFPRESSFPRKFIYSSLINLMRWHGSRVEGKIVKKVDLFYSVNTSLCDYFEKKYNLKGLKVLMNLPVFSAAVNVTKPFSFKQYFNLEESNVIILYQGAINEGRGLSLMVKAAKYLNKNTKLIILGNGTLKRNLVDFVKSNDLESAVKFMDAVSVQDLPTYTAGADFGINLLEDFNLSKKLASPNKLFEYMHAGIPVLSSFSPENDIIYRKFEIGLQCENNPENIALKMNQLSELNTNMIEQYRSELNKAKHEYCWEKQEAILKDII